MNNLNIPYIHTDKRIAAADIPSVLDKAGAKSCPISSNNWKEKYPYAPKATFRLACTDNALLIHYHVEEDTVRATAADNGNVWEDSCCELFIAPDADSPFYYNIECNCAGQMLIGAGPGRSDRERAQGHILGTVDRWSTLGEGPFDEKPAPEAWELCLYIPCSALFKHHIATLAGTTVGANVYKCGDKLSRPHYLSWNPITTPRPDFHRPDAVGRMTFDK